MNNKNKQTIINLISQILSFFVGLGVSFVLTPYITAQLGKDVYGFVGMAYQMTSYISIFTVAFNAMLNIFVATSYYRNDIEQANRFYSSVAIADRLLSILLIIPLGLIIVYMQYILDIPKSSLTDIKILWFFVFLTFLLSLYFGMYSCCIYVKNRMDLSSKRNIEINIIKAVLLLVMFVFFEPRVWYIGFAALITSIYGYIWNFFYMKKLTPELVISRRYYSFDAVKELLGVGIWNTINQLTYTLTSGLDLIVSNIFIDSLAMGYISYAQTVPIQMWALIKMVSGIFAPQLNKTYALGNEQEFLKETKSSLKICGFLCSIPVIGFVVFGRSFYSLWIPSLSVEEVNKINILSFLIMFHTLLDVYLYPLYNIQSIMKKIKVPMILAFILSMLNIGLELILLKTTNLGVYAVELATAIIMMVKVVIITPIYTAKIMKQKWYAFYGIVARGVLSVIIIFSLFIFIYSHIYINSWVELIVYAIIAGIIGYIVNGFIILDKKDRKKIKALICKK